MKKIFRSIIIFFIVASIAASPMTGVQARNTSSKNFELSNTSTSDNQLPNFAGADIVTPTALSPTGIFTDTTPTYVWSRITGATQYQYLLYKGATLVYLKTLLATTCGSMTNCANTPTTILTYGAYTWKVRAMVASVWKPYTPLMAFTLVAPASVIPVPQTPSVSTTDDTPTFTWSKIGAATQYQFVLYNGATQIYTYVVPSSACVTSVCSNTPVNSLPNAAYTWKVRAYVTNVWRPYSLNKAFTLSAPITIPTTIAPVGNYFAATPTYVWTKIAAATSYQYDLYQNTTLIYTKLALPTICGATNCTITPTTVLPAATYTWRVRALVGGLWRAYTAPKTFVYYPTPPFASSFTSDALGWLTSWGTWQIKTGGGYYITPGVPMTFSSVKHQGLYTTLTFEAKMNRYGSCSQCGNFLLIRGVELPLDPTVKFWDTSLRFQYTNSGYYSVWKTKDGVQTMIKDWTQTPIILPYNWNILKVTAIDSNMKFYINNTLLWSGTNIAAQPVGQVGLGMYTNTTSDMLYVDYANLTPVVTAAASAEDIETSVPVEGVPGEGNPNVSP